MCSSVWKNLWGVYVLKALIWVLNSVYWTKLQKIRFLERFTLSELRLWGHRDLGVVWIKMTWFHLTKDVARRRLWKFQTMCRSVLCLVSQWKTSDSAFRTMVRIPKSLPFRWSWKTARYDLSRCNIHSTLTVQWSLLTGWQCWCCCAVWSRQSSTWGSQEVEMVFAKITWLWTRLSQS